MGVNHAVAAEEHRHLDAVSNSRSPASDRQTWILIAGVLIRRTSLPILAAYLATK